jgi:5-methylcytosine-specific restriction endonuclease McrA
LEIRRKLHRCFEQKYWRRFVMNDLSVNNQMPFRTCSRCGERKPTSRDNFGTQPNGLPRARCRACVRQATNDWAEQNREAGRERARQRKERLESVGVVNEHLQFRGPLLCQQKSKCYFCNAAITTDTIEIDHLTPISRGGTNAYSNLAGCCARCNKAKGDRTEGEFLQWRQTRLRFYS